MIKALLLLRILKSLKTEARVVLISMSVILLLPAFAVVVIAGTGVAAVSDAFAAVDPITHKIEIHDPNGRVTFQLNASTVWPVRGVVTLEYGQPDPPYGLPHTGIDVARKTGDPITPFMAGKVKKVVHSNVGLGNYVVIDHGNSITSVYGHMSETKVAEQQEVKPGDVIGLEGSVGNSTGPHVHFEIRVSDIPVNPRMFMIGDPPR